MLLRQRRGGLRLTLALVLAIGLLTGCGGKAKGATSEMLLATGQNGDLIQISASSQKQTTLVHFNTASVLDPSVSPDGGRIAFVRSPDYTVGQTDFGTDLYIANRDGSSPSPVVKHALPSELLRWPVWLMDGKTLLFQVQGASAAGIPTSRLDKVDIATGARSRFIENGLTPSLSRDGSTLAYVTNDLTQGLQQIWVTDAAGTTLKSIVQSNASVGAFGYVSPSPDGSRVAFGAASLNADAPALPRPAFISGATGVPGFDPSRLITDGLPEDIWLVNRDGSGLKRLTALAEDQPSICWSSDGNQLYSMGSTGLWRIDLATGSKQKVGEGVFHGEIVLVPKT